MLEETPTLYLGVAVAVLVAALSTWPYFTGRRPHRFPPPPGPPGFPIIGNVKNIPAVDTHLAYAQLARKYGPIMQLRVLGKRVIVVSNVQIAVDLLEKRGAIYSGSPVFHTIWEAGFTWVLAFMPYNDTWRVRRQLVQQYFSTKSMSTLQMHGLLRRIALEFAKKILHSPQDFQYHIRHMAASIISAVYGVPVMHQDNTYVEIAARAIEALGSTNPGANLMDAVPLLRLIPAWVPVVGSWTAQAHKQRPHAAAMLEVAYARVKDDVRAGRAQPCMVHDALGWLEMDASLSEDDIKAACAVAYLGGADTTASTLLSFVLAMVLWPACQTAAQAELDRVLGDRLPEPADQGSLPYCEAVIRETLRLYPVGPLGGIPHAADADDVYGGYFIRRGSIVVVNIWDILHNEEVYPEPETFNPDRWLKDGRIDDTLADPRSVVFGFGRRICPGRHYADASIFLIIATALKCFDFGCHVEDGVAKPPTGKIDSGVVSCPAPFKCTITPRSHKIETMIAVALETCVD